ncbi:MAG: hypothetical protein ACJ788_22410 [Ktedonobacteraceae bacterium]
MPKRIAMCATAMDEATEAQGLYEHKRDAADELARNSPQVGGNAG